MLLILVWIAMYFDKENFLIEIIKIIGYGWAGFWAGSSRQNKNLSPPDTTEKQE